MACKMLSLTYHGDTIMSSIDADGLHGRIIDMIFCNFSTVLLFVAGLLNQCP